MLVVLAPVERHLDSELLDLGSGLAAPHWLEDHLLSRQLQVEAVLQHCCGCYHHQPCQDSRPLDFEELVALDCSIHVP